MKSLVTLYALLLIAPIAYAQEAVIRTAPSSTVFLKIVTDAAGKQTVTEMSVFTPTGTPVNPTNPTDPPPPLDPTSIQPTIKTITLDTLNKPGATKQTAAGLSAAYSLVSKGIADNSLSISPKEAGDRSPAQAALDLAVGVVLNKASAEDRAAWTQWRTAVTGVLTQMANNGDLSTKAQWTARLNEVHLGIDSATGVPIDVTGLVKIDPAKAAILDGITLKDIIELIKLLLELFSAFKG